MDVAITGATGFIGTALRERLEGEGHRVLSLIRPQTSPRPARVALWDPYRAKIEAGALEGIDAVVHLAGVSIGTGRGTKKTLAAIRDSRVGPTRFLAESLAKLQRPPKVMISQSAIGYYGDASDRVLTEDAPAGEDFLAKVCADWEAAASPASDAGIRVVRTRTGLVLDPGGGLLKRMLLPTKLGLGATLGSGAQWQSWIALDDQLAAMIFLLTSDLDGPVNLVAPEPVTNAEMTRLLAAAVGRKARLRAPQSVLNLALREELGEALTVSQRVSCARLQRAGFAFRWERLQDALAAMLGRAEPAAS